MKLEDVIQRDDRASQPLATSVPIGTLYYVTDENVTERSNGTTWDDVSDASSGGDHGALTGLSDDDHTQYALLVGRSGGQTLKGGTGSGDDLTLRSTSNATKGDIFLADEGGHVTLGGGATASELRFLEPSGGGTSYIALKAPALGGNVTLTLPVNDGAADDVLSTDGSGVLSWTAQTGGSSSLGIWLSDAAPSSPGSEDDEFADASGGVPSGWTEFDPGTAVTVTEETTGLKIVQADGINFKIGGVYKAIPAGNFTIWTKYSSSNVKDSANGVHGGLTLFEDATNSTGDIITFEMDHRNGSYNLQYNLWNQYDSYNTTVVNYDVSSRGPTPTYLRISRTSTTYTMFVSSDGVGWIQIFSGTISFTPTHFGLHFVNQSSGAAAAGYFSFFRYVASDVGITGVVGGNRV